MYFLRTFVFSAVLWASGAIAVTLPVDPCDEKNVIEIKIKMQHEPSIPEGAGEASSWISQKLVFP